MKRIIIALIMVVGITPAAAIDSGAVGDLILEALVPSSSDAVVDEAATGRSFLDTIEKMRHGGKVEMPDQSCGTPQCLGVFLALEAFREARARQHAEWKRRNKR